MITGNGRSEAKGCNGFHKAKAIVLLMRRHSSEKAICLYTLTYIGTRGLVPRRGGIVLRPNRNRLVCPREYARKGYTWT